MSTLAPNATPKEIAFFAQAMMKEAGTKSDFIISINTDGTCRLALYPNGVCSDGCVVGKGENWNDAATSLQQLWDAQRSNHRSIAIRKMALEIIQITADQGECTDRALRLTFDQYEIDGLGAEAAEMANEMASNGPFSITRTASANAA